MKSIHQDQHPSGGPKSPGGWPGQSFKGTVLLHVLIVAVLLAVFMTALITLSFYQRQVINQDIVSERLINYVTSGIMAALENPSNASCEAVVGLSADKSDTLLLKKMPWGMFDVLCAKAFRRMSHDTLMYERTAMVGQPPNEIGRAALFVQENAKPVIVSGKTLITGTGYIPRAGIRPGFVGSIEFKGTQIIQGEEKKSSRKMPDISKSRFEQILHWFVGKHGTSHLPSTLHTEFTKSTSIFREKVFKTNAARLSGNICIIADSLIVVQKASDLKDVILIAPNIIIEKGVTGCFQAFAFQHLVIEDGVHLRYPSVLAILRKKEETIPCSNIDINTNATIEGAIIAVNLSGKLLPNTVPVLVSIVKAARVTGQVYVDGHLNLTGTVTGNVICKNFSLITEGATYDNYLMDAIIDVTRRSDYYAGPLCFPSDPDKKSSLCKWLD